MTDSFCWPAGHICAVSLTYDDALPIHREHVAPRLEAHGLRGTFYLNVSADPIRNPEEWRDLARRGHELGNHSLFHPCVRSSGERASWLDKAFDLRDYTPLRLQLELQVATAFLQLLDGRRERSYAYTCCDLFIGRRWKRKPIADLIRNSFIAARGARLDRAVAVSPTLDLIRVGGYLADGRTFDEIREQIDRARNDGGWLVCVIHGIGSATHSSYIDAAVHERLLTWLAGQHGVWVRPFIEVATWIREWQQRKDAIEGPLRSIG